MCFFFYLSVLYWFSIQRSELIIWNDAVSSFDSSKKKRQIVCIKKGKPLIDIENLQQTEFETHLMIIGYSRE